MTQETPEQLRHRYEVERQLANELKNADAATRRKLYPTLYQRLFQQCPHHPRLTLQQDPEAIRQAVQARMRILKPFLSPQATFLEIAPGDCQLAFAAAAHVKRAIGIDISAQSNLLSNAPGNFHLILYDGYDFPVAPHSIDIIFSYQVIEHIHPDDLPNHFAQIHRSLTPNGFFIFDTPHRASGPHDVSRHFSATPQGFHLKEWTLHEIIPLLRSAGFSRILPIRRARTWPPSIAIPLTICVETMLVPFPTRLRQKLAARLLPSITLALRP
ncbi:MAG: class I SAM-dependent methyltransferase [Lentisphaerae bacterium]|nr:MAG: class I SAM-dependent methyltransferase [Lentisphaerota bacterium]